MTTNNINTNTSETYAKDILLDQEIWEGLRKLVEDMNEMNRMIGKVFGGQQE